MTQRRDEIILCLLKRRGREGRADRAVWTLVLLLALAAASLHAAPKPGLGPDAGKPILQICGAAGQACCKDFGPGGSVVGPPNCGVGLGCDTKTNRCVASCGGAGQPCCDGPDTVAPRGGASPSGFFRDELKPMCATGACSTESHRCTTCGQLDGLACCPPDAQMAVPTCPAPGLHCRTWEGDWTRGVCVSCGHQGETPCPSDRCESGLLARDGVCVPCGRLGLIACNDGCSEGVARPVNVPVQTCVPCGSLGQPPCDFGVCREGEVVRMVVCASGQTCGAFALDAVAASRTILEQCLTTGTVRVTTDFIENDRWCQGHFRAYDPLRADSDARYRYLARCAGCKAQAIDTAFAARGLNHCGNADPFWSPLETVQFDRCMGMNPSEMRSDFVRHFNGSPCGGGGGGGGGGGSSPPPPSNHCCWVSECTGGGAPPGPGVPGGPSFPGGGTQCVSVHKCGPMCP